MGRFKKKSLPKVLPIQKQPSSIGATSYQKLATTLLLKGSEQACQTILVTSTERGEGKSTTAINLSLTLNKMGKRVILVDADLEQSILDKALSLSNENGLTNYLVNTLKEVHIQSTAEGLAVVTSGSSLKSNGLLVDYKSKMKKLIDHLKPKAEYIVIDTSPLLTTSNPLIFASLVDWVLLVVRQGVTKRYAGQQAAALLREANIQILGVVLNDINHTLNGYS